MTAPTVTLTADPTDTREGTQVAFHVVTAPVAPGTVTLEQDRGGWVPVGDPVALDAAGTASFTWWADRSTTFRASYAPPVDNTVPDTYTADYREAY